MKTIFIEKPICGFGGMNDLAAKALFGSSYKEKYPYGPNTIVITDPMPKGQESKEWHIKHESSEREKMQTLISKGVTIKQAYKISHAVTLLQSNDVSSIEEGIADANKMFKQAKKCKVT